MYNRSVYIKSNKPNKEEAQNMMVEFFKLTFKLIVKHPCKLYRIGLQNAKSF